jgi:hypothetical protein
MERGVSKIASLIGVAFVAAVAGVGGCGAGLYDGDGAAEVTTSIGVDGGEITLGQAQLKIDAMCLLTPTSITLRRYQSLAQTGAYGPVFQIEIPTPETFTDDPTLEIVVPPSVETRQDLVLGFLVPGLYGPEQWVPTTSNKQRSPTRLSGAIQSQGFVNNGVTALDYAIIVPCNATSQCSKNQACSSGACQRCNQNSECNFP